ncbi:hypothetical protein, partial [Brevibacillus sp. MCWH]|uniref:hypothetical protein n=1 Tax=Brevibacillus sp. MCWH TaxID=2508871 RepID=UPI001491C17B
TLKSKLNAITKERTDEGVYILYKPQDCKCECPYQKFYDDVYRNKSLNEIDMIKSDISSLEHKREMYLEMVTIKQKIDSIASIIRANKNINDKTGNKYLDLKRILHCINTYCNIYDEDEITETISLLEEYEEYLSIDNKIKDVLKENKLLEDNKENNDELYKEIV